MSEAVRGVHERTTKGIVDLQKVCFVFLWVPVCVCKGPSVEGFHAQIAVNLSEFVLQVALQQRDGFA